MQDADHQSADPDASIDHDLSQDDIAMQTHPSTKAFGKVCFPIVEKQTDDLNRVRSRQGHSVRPVTLRQVLDAKQDYPDKKADWKLYDRDIDNVRDPPFCGIARWPSSRPVSVDHGRRDGHTGDDQGGRVPRVVQGYRWHQPRLCDGLPPF